jgi:hypothetical protein
MLVRMRGQVGAPARARGGQPPEGEAATVVRRHPASPVGADADAGVTHVRWPLWVQRCGDGTCDCAAGEQRSGGTPLGVRRSSTDGGTPPPESRFLASLQASGGGQALPAGFRRQAEWGFGTDFPDVRIHTDAAAADAAARISADAFTVGNAIFFGSGRFDPGGTDGRRLLAHEITHVVQRKLEPAARSSWLSQPGSPSELEAEAVADRFVAGAPDATPAIASTASGLVQGQAATAPAADGKGAAADIAKAATDGDVGAVVGLLRRRSVADLVAIREAVRLLIGMELERWLVARIRGAAALRTGARGLRLLSIVAPGLAPLGTVTTFLSGYAGGAAEEGLRLLWLAVPLIDRLEIYDEGWRELEQSQLDVIRAASQKEREAAAKQQERLEAIFSRMSAKEEFEARSLINSTPEGQYTAADRLLSRAPGFFSDEEDPVFDAVLALTPTLRRKFYDQHLGALWLLLSTRRFFLLRTLAYGTEAQALVARLRLATEGRIDDAAAVQAVVDRAVGLLRERRELQASLARTLPAEARATAEARIAELKDLDDLLSFTPGAGGGFEAGSFMGKLASARGDEETFGADARRLAEFATGASARGYALAVAKQRILLAGADADSIRSVLMSLHAPRVEAAAAGGPAASPSAQQAADVRLRQELLADPAVGAVLGKLTGSERMLVSSAVQAGPFEEMLNRVAAAMNSAQWGEFFRLILEIARNDDWRARYRATATDPTSPYARAQGEVRMIMEKILATQRIPFDALFAYSGNVALLRTALSELPEDERGRLRLGRFLASQPTPVGPPTPEQDAALREYRDFEAQLRASQTSWLGTFDAAGFQDVLNAALGSEPTMEEVVTGEGRFRAAELMYQQQRARLGLERGVSAEFTETDETMVAAAREFAGRFEPLRPAGTLKALDFYALGSLHARFESRAEEFVESSNMVGEMAGMVAATVAGVVVVAATGGSAAPAVIALAAASGAGARVITRDMFGGEYYNALSDAGARDLLLGAVDGALAVVGQSLAARGAELLGLGERALAKGAAELAGEVAEQATHSFSKKVAAEAVKAALDGAFSGAVSQAVGTMTEARTWRRGIWQGLLQVGEAALVAGLTGLATGGLMGAAMPVLGATARWLRTTVVGRRIEDKLARAGATEALGAARRAAQAGRVDEVNRLAAELESHLNPEEAKALRQQLSAELRRPTGTVAAADEARARLLAESSTIEGSLDPAHLDAELDIVRHSEPKPSTVEGYVDEVDLGNGHTWRRRSDGTWCRFSNGRVCVPGFPGKGASEVIKSVEDVDKLLEPLRPRLDHPPPSVKSPEDLAMWELYQEYFSERVSSIRNDMKTLGFTEKNLPWDFDSFRKTYTDNPQLIAALRGRLAQSRTGLVLGELTSGKAAQNLGISKVAKPGPGEVVYPDFVWRGEKGYTAVSSKERDFSRMTRAEVKKTVEADVDEMLGKYYGKRYVRRPGLEVTGQLIDIDEVVLHYTTAGLPEELRAEIIAIAQKHGGAGIKVSIPGSP